MFQGLHTFNGYQIFRFEHFDTCTLSRDEHFIRCSTKEVAGVVGFLKRKNNFTANTDDILEQYPALARVQGNHKNI